MNENEKVLIFLLETCLHDDSIRLTCKKEKVSERLHCSIHWWWCHYAQLNFCECVIEFSRCMFVWCKLENESKKRSRSQRASRISFSFIFYLKWISMSFVIETSSRRFASLITSCWCNTTVVSTLPRLSFSVSLDRFKSYRISLWSFIYPRVITMSSVEKIQTDR
jgi:hypothetical protein